MRHICVAASFVLVLSICAAVFAGEAAGVAVQSTDQAQAKAIPQATCPVMGGKIDKQYYADYQGKRVYFCCSGCIKEFQKDPAKYVKKLEDSGVTLEKAPVVQTTCPVTGDKVDKSQYVDYQGKRIYTCCSGCVEEVKKDPAKYVKQLEDQGITLEKTPEPDMNSTGACPAQ